MPQEKPKEKIACRICWLDHEVSESVVCPCGNRILTSGEIREKIKGLEKQALDLRTQATLLQAELWARERRRTATDEKGKVDVDFWKNVKGKPYEGGRERRPSDEKKKPAVVLTRRQMNEFM